jgi:hypothetical protein
MIYAKYLFLLDLINLGFLERFSKISQISNFMKTLLVGVELFHAEGDGRTDRRRDRQTDSHDEDDGRFAKFCKPAKKCLRVSAEFRLKFHQWQISSSHGVKVQVTMFRTATVYSGRNFPSFTTERKAEILPKRSQNIDKAT